MKTNYSFEPDAYRFAELDQVKLVVIASKWHGEAVEGMLSACLDCLKKVGVEESQLAVYRVPGALEIPVVAKKLLAKGEVDALLVFGAVVRGDTRHFEMVVDAVNDNLNSLAVEFVTPIIQQVLAVDNLAQLVARTGNDDGNKGIEAAIAALEMIKLFKTELH
jgi:6,7-dimethyl-8-ribityllumazine synthase